MKGIVAFVTFIVLVLAGDLACEARDWKTYTPLPGDISIEAISAESNVGPKIRALLGVWQGEWHGMGAWASPAIAGQPTTIIVEKIFGTNVLAVFSWGPFVNEKGGWTRVLGSIEGDRLLFVLGRSTGASNQMTLELRKETAATAYYQNGALQWQADLSRREFASDSNRP